jgi:hypothetical protein
MVLTILGQGYADVDAGAACTNRTNGSQGSNELLPDGLGRGCMRALAGLEGDLLRRLDLPVQILLVRSSNVTRSDGGSL